MPELPDIMAYLDALDARVSGTRLVRSTLRSPFVLRSVEPPIEVLNGARAVGVRRLGKRIVIEFEAARFLVLHLRIAGRLRWRDPGRKPGIGTRRLLAVFEFERGTLLFTEAGSRKRASIVVVAGEAALAAIDPGGLEPLDMTLDAFRAALARERHTVKRTLTDPRILSGIGNVYSDEILHAARLSPLRLSTALTEEECGRLYEAVRGTLASWAGRLRTEARERFPEQVTAFRPEMAVHGRFGKPCPDCGAPIQRIVYVENECNYCARCQTGGKRLADRSLSRLLGADWPRSIDDA